MNGTDRPRMVATYAPGTVRARRWHGEGDVRGVRLRAEELVEAAEVPSPRLDGVFPKVAERAALGEHDP